VNLKPNLEDLLSLEVPGGRLFLLADLLDGARAAFVLAGELVGETLHAIIIPKGSMLVVVGPEIAAAHRPLKTPSRGPLDAPTSPIVEVGPLRIPILVDVAADPLEVILTKTTMPNGPPWPSPLPTLPAGSMLALFPPDLAHHVRRELAKAVDEAKRQAAHGPAVQ
jgi:hypothetical protein